MKLNEVRFSLGTVITDFLDKPYQEINFKSHLNSVLPCKKGKTLRFTQVSCDFISLYLIAFNFTMRLKSANYKSHWNRKVIEILKYFTANENNVRFEYVPWKNVWFCFIYIYLSSL